MGPLLEGTSLQEAICTTLVQLCKVGVSYKSELSIKGTIGVTVDKSQIILVHVDEHFDNRLCSDEKSLMPSENQSFPSNLISNESNSKNSQSLPNIEPTVGGSTMVVSTINSPRVVSVSAANTAVNPLSLGQTPHCIASAPANLPPVVDSLSTSILTVPPAVGSGHAVPISFWQHAMRSVYSQIKITHGNPRLADSTNLSNTSNRPTTSQVDNDIVEGERKSKLLTLSETAAIDLDSESESFSPLQFDAEDDPSYKGSEFQWMEKKEPHDTVMDHDYVEPAIVRNDVKNIIVIDDAVDLINDDVIDQSETDAASLTEDDERHKWNLHRSLNSSSEFLSSAVQLKAESLEGRDAVATSSGQSGPPEDSESIQGALSHNASHIDWPWENKREKIQSGTASSECEICKKTFTFVSSAHLECHLVESHNVTVSRQLGPIPHKCCPHCDKKFRFQTTLEKHLFVHIDQKPYKCNKCPNAYCYEESLNIHKASHEGYFKCGICNRTYTNRKLFQKHIIYMHEMRRSTRKNIKKNVT